MIKKIILSTTFLAILCCLLWATPFVGIKIGLKYSSPLQFAGLRFFISGLMILPFIKDFKNRFISSFKYWKLMIGIALIQTTFLYSLFYIGLNMVPGSLGAMIVGSGPITVAITAHFMIKDDKMNWQKFIAVLLGMIGVIIVILGNQSDKVNEDSLNIKNTVLSSSILLGSIILLVKNTLNSIGNVIIAKKANHIYPRVLAAFSLTFGGFLILVISFFFEKPSWNLMSYPLEFFISWIWLSIVSAVAIAIWYSLLQRPNVKVSVLNFWTFIIPVFGAIMSWIILPDENPNIKSILGMLIICLSLIMINYYNRKAIKPTINRLKHHKDL